MGILAAIGFPLAVLDEMGKRFSNELCNLMCGSKTERSISLCKEASDFQCY
jgi:hypothetical protein